MEKVRHGRKIPKKECHQSDDSASGEERKSVKENKHRASSKLTPMSETMAKQVADAVKGRVQPKGSTNLINKPVNQITTSSYLGKALREVHERSAMQDAPVPSGDSSSLSLLSSSDSNSESEEHKRQDRSKRQNRRNSRAKKVNERQKRCG
jgi:hypothetical protein